MSSLRRAFTTYVSDEIPAVGRTVTIVRRDKVSWASEDHHSYSWWTRNRNGFVNPWKSFHKPTMLELVGGATFARIEEGVHAVDERDLREVAEESLNLIKPPSWAGASWSSESARSRVRVTWLGHAGVLVQFSPNQNGEMGFNVLMDPIFSMRASPSKTAGPSRIVESPCTVKDLPPIHAVLLSHNQ